MGTREDGLFGGSGSWEVNGCQRTSSSPVPDPGGMLPQLLNTLSGSGSWWHVVTVGEIIRLLIQVACRYKKILKAILMTRCHSCCSSWWYITTVGDYISGSGSRRHVVAVADRYNEDLLKLIRVARCYDADGSRTALQFKENRLMSSTRRNQLERRWSEGHKKERNQRIPVSPQLM